MPTIRFSCRQGRRRGITLAEMLVVITFSSLLMISATKLLLLMFHVQRNGREQQQASRTLDRLFDTFQRDVHRSTRHARPQPSVGGPSRDKPNVAQPRRVLLLQLQTTRETIEYHAAHHRLHRTVRQGAKTVARESFHLPESARAEFHAEDASGTLLTLAIKSTPPGGTNSIEVIRVHALLGRDLRYAAAKKEEP